MTLTASEAMRIILMLERLSQRCGEAYQVVGSLADSARIKDDPAVQKALDLLSFQLRPGEILPFNTEKGREIACKMRKPKPNRGRKPLPKRAGASLPGSLGYARSMRLRRCGQVGRPGIFFSTPGDVLVRHALG